MPIISVWVSDGNDRQLEGVYETEMGFWDFVDAYRARYLRGGLEEDGDEEQAFLIHYITCEEVQAEFPGDTEICSEDCEGDHGKEFVEFILGIPGQPHRITVWD